MNIIKQGSRGSDVTTLQKKLNLIADGIFGPITCLVYTTDAADQ